MASELCMNCFSVKGPYEVCPYCGYVEGTPPKQPHYLTPGTLLKNLIVGTVIGVGGFGITYKCYDATLGIIKAVKEFYIVGLVNRAPGERRVGLLSGDKEQQYKERLQRFHMEAQSVAQFGKAKDIVNVYDYFEENGTAYMVMEYIDGVLLKDYLEKQGPMDPEAALGAIMPIMEAVKKMHSKGIIHRDVSPDNIFIASEESIKLFDFGAAQLNETKTGMAAEPVIKVGYSPLEQYRNANRQGFYTDVYAVGAILYQMLTGMAPIESTEREFKDKLKSPREVGVKISANADRAVMEALAVRPELRFQGIQQFQDALLNKRIAEYPKDKLRRKKRKRYAVIGLFATLAVAVGAAAGLYGSVLKPKDRIFRSAIDGPAKIAVWVENKDQKVQIEELVKSGFKKGKNPEEDEDLREMQRQNENVEVEVAVQSDMEAALDEARKDKKKPLPNMFLTDHVSNVDDYSLISLEDNYNRLNLDKYVFMADYAKNFPGMKEMPTGVDTLLLYASEIGYHKSNRLDSSTVQASGKEDGIQTVELDKVFAGEETMEGNYLHRGRANALDSPLARALLLQQPKWRQAFTGEALPDKEMLAALSSVQQFRNAAAAPEFKLNCAVDEDGRMIAEEKPADNIYGSNLLAGVAFRKRINQAADRIREGKAEYANPITDYKAYVVTHEGRMIVAYAERYAITTEGSEDQQTACMRLLWVMQQEAGQAKKTGNVRSAYPIWRASFEQFPSYNAGYGDFIQMEKENYPCVLIGPESGQAQKFVEGLNGRQKKKELRAYSKEYRNAGRKQK